VSRIERILIWGVDPRVNTGYGQQSGLLALELRKLGYQVSIGAIGQKAKDRGKPWKSIPVRFVGGRGTHGSDVLDFEVRRCKADLVLTLCDSFMIDARVLGSLDCRVAFWAPVDAIDPGGGVPVLYRGMLRLAPKAVPIAMSRWAERMFRRDGHEPLYVPHMLDVSVFRPMDRAALRAARGIDPDAFVITMCAANSERFRKNFPGQFDAFRRAAQDNWLLLVHTYCRPDQDGWDLEDLAARYGIADKVRFADPDMYRKGGYRPEDLAVWYNLGDLHSQCTLAEGFGIPLIEAQACGLPVVATDGSAMSELVGAGWTVPGEPIMNPGQRAEWIVPHRALIAEAYENWSHVVFKEFAAHRAREFALGFSVETVMAQYWKPALEALEER
jgi:glycosyltransferase involved in cell wall biosynthesis